MSRRLKRRRSSSDRLSMPRSCRCFASGGQHLRRPHLWIIEVVVIEHAVQLAANGKQDFDLIVDVFARGVMQPMTYRIGESRPDAACGRFFFRGLLSGEELEELRAVLEFVALESGGGFLEQREGGEAHKQNQRDDPGEQPQNSRRKRLAKAIFQHGQIGRHWGLLSPSTSSKKACSSVNCRRATVAILIPVLTQRIDARVERCLIRSVDRNPNVIRIDALRVHNRPPVQDAANGRIAGPQSQDGLGRGQVADRLDRIHPPQLCPDPRWRRGRKPIRFPAAGGC